MQMVAAFSFTTLPSIAALILAIVLPNVNFKKPREFSIHAFMALDWFGIAGYLCLTCSTLLNFLIYSLKNKVFRKCAVELMVDISKRFRCFGLINRMFRLRTMARRTFVSKTLESNVSKTTIAQNETFELASLHSIKR